MGLDDQIAAAVREYSKLGKSKPQIHFGRLEGQLNFDSRRRMLNAVFQIADDGRIAFHTPIIEKLRRVLHTHKFSLHTDKNEHILRYEGSVILSSLNRIEAYTQGQIAARVTSQGFDVYAVNLPIRRTLAADIGPFYNDMLAAQRAAPGQPFQYRPNPQQQTESSGPRYNKTFKLLFA